MMDSYLPFTYFTLELNNLNHLSKNLEQIKETYKSLFPNNPFEYFFLDEYFNAQYAAEEQFGNVFISASGLSIFIACLGLFGLSSFSVRQRIKEISIRKVLGAPIQNILILISKDYIILIIIASIISLPLTYIATRHWLENYTYRILLDWKMFLIPLVLIILIALFTVSYCDVTKYGFAVPDGLTVSSDGRIFLALYGDSEKLLVLDSDGNGIGYLSTGLLTSNCTFAKDGTTLYITADKKLMRVKVPF